MDDFLKKFTFLSMGVKSKISICLFYANSTLKEVIQSNGDNKNLKSKDFEKELKDHEPFFKIRNLEQEPAAKFRNHCELKYSF